MMKLITNVNHVMQTRVFLLLLLLMTSKGMAQFYPVQVTPQLIPPYSVYLSDYATPGSEKLRVIVLQRDLSQPAYQLRLVMSVEWNGKVIMRTARTFNPPPIQVEPGIPTVISGAELAPYLDSRNIDFVGYSREQYERTRALPEGSYRIFFTAYDYRRQDVQVSNEGSSFYYLAKNEPPLINYPACGTKIPARTPQQIVFSWLPRNTASPNSAAETEYEFSLYETRPAGRNPNDVVLTTQPVFRTRVDFTQLVYGPAEPMLFEGMKYVWRVQAIDKNGRDAFRNNGFSEVCTFTYGGMDATFDIGVVKNLQAEGETERRAKIWWQASNYDSYRVHYKKTGSGYEWFTTDIKTTDLKLFDLEPDTEYETRVQVRKSGVFGPYSDIIKFRTTPIRVVQCGDGAGLLAMGEGGQPLLAAHRGMTIEVDGLDVILTEVVPLGGGWYKGMGNVTTKILGASFAVKFDRLYIDASQQAGYGRVDFITRGVAELVQQQLVNQQRNQKQEQQEANRAQWAGTLFHEQIFKYDQLVITDISFENGVVMITDEDGNVHPNPDIIPILKDAPEKAIIIEDKNGDQYVVQKDGDGYKATKVEGGGLVVGGDGKMIDEASLSKLEKMILKALRKYLKAIEEYEASKKETGTSKGGGPSLFAWELDMLLAALPSCMQPYESQVGQIKANIISTITYEARLKKFSYAIITALNNDQSSSEERVEEVVCEELVGGLADESNKNQDQLVKIEPLKDDQFTPGIDDDKLIINYLIKKTDDVPLDFAKVEIYKNDGELIFSNSKDIQIGKDEIFMWDGKMNHSARANSYIRYSDSPFIVKILASPNEEFTVFYEDEAESMVSLYADEWNDATANIKSRIVINNAPSGTTLFQYYVMLREQMVREIGEGTLRNSGLGPLGYLDANDTTFQFLGKEISIHKNYQPIISEIENRMKEGGDYNRFYKKYPIGSYVIRFMNHSRVISDHSFGFALDVDWENNPQITSNENLFFLIVTGINFWFTNLTLQQMTNGSDLYRSRISESRYQSIVNGFNTIAMYNLLDDKYTFNDIIENSIFEIHSIISNKRKRIAERATYLVNELWFPDRVTREMRVELQIQIPSSCNEIISEIDTHIKKVTSLLGFCEYGLKQAYLFDYNFNVEYLYIRDYLKGEIESCKKIKNSYEKIISEIDEISSPSYLPSQFNISIDIPTAISFDLNRCNKLHHHLNNISKILESQGQDFKKFYDWLSSSNTRTVLMNYGNRGFFNLEHKFVNYFLSSKKIEWGGHWPKKRDWMHFQPTKEFIVFD